MVTRKSLSESLQPRRSLPRHEQQLSGPFASLVEALGQEPYETHHSGNAKGPVGGMEMRLEMQRLSRRAIPGRRMTPTRLITSVSSTSENQSLQCVANFCPAQESSIPRCQDSNDMIQPRPPFQAGEVAAHYDDLDRFYREIWGEHVHHGLWRSRQETTEEATYGLIAEVAAQARVRAGDRVCDVGCGYGGTSRILARDYGAKVTGLTVSAAQHEHAISLDPETANPSYLLRDWLTNDLEPASFDAVAGDRKLRAHG